MHKMSVQHSAGTSSAQGLPSPRKRLQEPIVGLPSAQLPEEQPEVQGTSIWLTLWTWISRLRSVALLGFVAASAAVACLGIALLVFLFVARTFAPATAHIVRPLYFDYTQLDAVATVSLIDSYSSTLYTHNLREFDNKNVSIPHSKERVLPPGEQYTLWVELQLPDRAATESEIFQAVGELRSVDSQPAARASRAVLPARRSLLTAPLRHLLPKLFVLSPLSAVGLWHEWTKMQVVLFERYTEQADKPFAVFECTLHGRAGGGLPPPVAKAALHIRLHLGVFRRMLYWVRPNTLVTVLLVLAALAAMLGGSCSAMILFGLWLWSISGGAGTGGEVPPDDDDISTESSGDIDGMSGALLSEEEEEVSSGADPLGAGGTIAEDVNLDFSMLSPSDAAAAGFKAPPRRRVSADAILPTKDISPRSQNSSGLFGRLGLSSPARRR